MKENHYPHLLISKAALFAAGLFFGGAIDHAILAMMRRDVTPYGVNSGVFGNWVFAGGDLLLTGALLLVHRRTEERQPKAVTP